jgi:predicted DsbA family dithiol-disulfide isomerase
MEIEIWSDVVCPWCYIGKRNFEAALARFEHRDAVSVRWRSFELNPGAPAEVEGRYVERLARKYGVDVEQAQAMIDRMTGSAAAAGLDIRFDISRPGSTFDAHRLLHLAHDRGRQGALKERLFAAMFSEGEPIGDRETLVRLAAEAGLDADDARAVLDDGGYADDVRADETEARELDVTGVPFFLVDRTVALSGAQPPDLLLRVLDRAWAKRASAN